MWFLHRTLKFYWGFRMQFAENFQANWQEGYCFIMTMPDPIQLEEPSTEFKNYSGNFLNIRLTDRTWPLVTPSVWSAKKTPWWQTFCWWQRSWNGGAEVAEITVKRLLCCGVWRTAKAMGQVCQCWWRICQEINAFPGLNITCFTFYIHLWPIYWLSLEQK
jgi:hypothetical protein